MRSKHVHSIQRDQSVSSGTQRAVVGKPLIGYALETDGVPVVRTPTVLLLILLKQ